ncbi:MAG TPA: hypothetical protein ENK57_20540 [Polyangiaceae bacterium]|nr:hypothetical protein [Polyangiaceae bacterium]
MVAHKVGQTLDRRWVLRRILARADHATAFEASHAFLDRVASIVVADPSHREKVLEEAAARDRTYHPGILGVLDVADTSDGVPYLAAAPFVGRPLDGVLMSRGSLPPAEAVSIVLALGDALCHLHALGVSHAALSPSCVLIDEGRAQLLDLGIFSTPLGALSGPLASMPYTAKERLTSGAPASRQTDVYAVAAMLAEMLSGEPPGQWPPADSSFPPPLVAVIDRGMQPPDQRYESMEALLTAIRAAQATGSIPPSLPPASRRECRRGAYVSAIRLRVGAGTIDGRTENISEGGLLIVGAGSVKRGDSVIARLALPSSGRIVSEPCTVRWVRSADGVSKAFGISFDDPAARTLAEVRTYIDLLGVPEPDPTK